MLVTKGIIKSIDYTSNTYNVNIPLFEGANNNFPVTLPATAAIPPGAFNGYKVDDVVIVTFEDNNVSKPIIIGKLYLGASQEKQDTRGTLSCNSLYASGVCEIPVSTKIVTGTDSEVITPTETAVSKYKTIEDILTTLNKLGGATTQDSIPRTVYCLNQCLNIASYKISNYGYVKDSSMSCYLITYDNNTTITANQAIGYMAYMTGSTTLPILETGKPPITLVTADWRIYYLDWDAANSMLKLHIINDEGINDRINRLIDESGTAVTSTDVSGDTTVVTSLKGGDAIDLSGDVTTETKSNTIEVVDLTTE